MRLRLIVFALILVSIAFLPYWIYLPALLIALLAFPFFWEGMIIAFLIDALYGGYRFDSLFLGFPIAAASGAILLIVPLVHKSLRFHA